MCGAAVDGDWPLVGQHGGQHGAAEQRGHATDAPHTRGRVTIGLGLTPKTQAMHHRGL